MGQAIRKYDTACYYGDKLLGWCTPADGEAYSTLMEACGGDATRVLLNYSYFSPELKTILEKTVAIQERNNAKNPSPGLLMQPKDSPWGEVDSCDTLCPGVFLVSTPGHGGIMVSKNIEEVLSPAARKIGQRKNNFICFEEDCDEFVVFRELLDKGLWNIPDRVKDKASFEDGINKALKVFHPDYWRSREQGRQNLSHNDKTKLNKER